MLHSLLHRYGAIAAHPFYYPLTWTLTLQRKESKPSVPNALLFVINVAFHFYLCVDFSKCDDCEMRANQGNLLFWWWLELNLNQFGNRLSIYMGTNEIKRDIVLHLGTGKLGSLKNQRFHSPAIINREHHKTHRIAIVRKSHTHTLINILHIENGRFSRNTT